MGVEAPKVGSKFLDAEQIELKAAFENRALKIT
jgi:hypothetical protein